MPLPFSAVSYRHMQGTQDEPLVSRKNGNPLSQIEKVWRTPIHVRAARKLFFVKQATVGDRNESPIENLCQVAHTCLSERHTARKHSVTSKAITRNANTALKAPTIIIHNTNICEICIERFELDHGGSNNHNSANTK